MVDQKQAQGYVDSVMKTFAETPDKLSAPERQLAQKCAEGRNRIEALTRDADTMRRQISQAQARLQQLEMGVEGEQGRINGFVELMVEAKFGGNGADSPEPESPEKPVNRKQRRAEQAKAKAKASAKKPDTGDPPRATA